MRESGEARGRGKGTQGTREQGGGAGSSETSICSTIKGKRAYNNWVQGRQNTQDSIEGEHVKDITNIRKVKLTTYRFIHCVTEPASDFSHIHGGE